MRKSKLMVNGLLSTGAIAAMLLVSSCGEDPAPVPTASFTYEADGRDVTFTNTSTNATTYAWDFGDGETSTEENPVHTYAVYGDYTVTLKATGEGGTTPSLPDQIKLAKSSPVIIDGTLSEWADIPAVQGASFGTITTVKVDYDALNIYFYVEGPSGPGSDEGGLNGFFDIYLNSDNNPATGFSSDYYPAGFGADYLVEGDFAVLNDAPIYKFLTPDVTDDFTNEKVVEMGANVVKSSDIVAASSGDGIEFSVSRSTFDFGDKFTYAIIDVDGAQYFDDGTKSRDYAETWVTLGSFPKDHVVDTGKLMELDLTK